MSFIPEQPVEISVAIILGNDTRIKATIFPLASHAREHPVDLLEGFLNGRKGEFFPIRLHDGKEMLVPLRDCLVFELTREAEEEAFRKHHDMSHESLSRSTYDVVSYCLVALTLATGRTVRGSLWFHGYDLENTRNLMDYLNGGRRYILLHSEHRTYFVRKDRILRAQIYSEADSLDSGGVRHLPAGATHDSRLVDTHIDFAPIEGAGDLQPVGALAENDTQMRSGSFLRPLGEGIERIERLAKTRDFPKPTSEDIEKE